MQYSRSSLPQEVFRTSHAQAKQDIHDFANKFHHLINKREEQLINYADSLLEAQKSKGLDVSLEMKFTSGDVLMEELLNNHGAITVDRKDDLVDDFSKNERCSSVEDTKHSFSVQNPRIDLEKWLHRPRNSSKTTVATDWLDEWAFNEDGKEKDSFRSKIFDNWAEHSKILIGF